MLRNFFNFILKKEKSQKFVNLVKELTEKICSGNYSWEHVALLLVYLRPLISNKSLLYDLINFVPHGDIRDRGKSKEYVESYIRDLIKVAEGQGPISFGSFAPKPIFSLDIILSEIIKAIRGLNIQFNQDKLVKEKQQITDCILKIVDQTTFTKFHDKRIVECVLAKGEDDRMLFYFRLENLKDGAIRGVTRKMRFAIPFLQ
jgi:hypothetical protein